MRAQDALRLAVGDVDDDVTRSVAVGHAGTVPMGLRRDAFAAAAECALAVEGIARDLPEVVGTVGRVDVEPGAINVIPGKVRFSLDVRAPTDPLRERAIARRMNRVLPRIAPRTPGEMRVESGFHRPAMDRPARHAV